MRIAPTLPNESERLGAVRAAHIVYAPHEERFDRITRAAQKALHVPFAMLSLVEEDEQWFRSVQGLQIDSTSRDVSFCAHAIGGDGPLVINDTLASDDFRDNPLVAGAPGIRAYLGWPLEVAPGIKAGALCVVDTMPRNFSPQEIQALKELAVLAEAELKKISCAGLQGQVMRKLGDRQRKSYLDPLTGCWNLSGLRKVVASGLVESRKSGDDLAVCCWHVEYSDQIASQAHFHNQEALIQPLAQALRRRLPEDGVLARLDRSSFCAVLGPAPAAQLELDLARLKFRSLTVDSPDSPSRIQIPVRAKVTMLFEHGQQTFADEFWKHVRSRLN